MLDENITNCAREIREALSEKVVDQLGADAGFFRRRRKVTPLRFLWSLLVGLGTGTTRTIADLHRLFMQLTEESVEYKPFHLKLANPGFPEFLRRVLEHSMTDLIGGMPAGRLKEFSDILLHDGSAFAVNDRLKNAFPGKFAQAPAAVAIHCTYSLYERQPVSVAVSPYVDAERWYVPDPADLKGKLLLVDAGYLNTEYFCEVKRQGGDVICRAKGNLNPRIVKSYNDAVPDELLGEKVYDLEYPDRNIDLIVECNRKDGRKFRVRMVGVWVKDSKEHVWLFTTLAQRKFSPGRVSRLYRLRWQIELFFKECKSYTNLQKFQTANRHVAEGLVWASMLAVLFRRFLQESALKGSQKRPAQFVAGSLAWTYLPHLGESAVRGYRKLEKALRRAFRSLRGLATRTNPHRNDHFRELGLVPVDSG